MKEKRGQLILSPFSGPRNLTMVALLLVLVAYLAAPAEAATTESQPPSQAPSALTKPSTPVCAPPCLSAEQEAALVEVRKILKEARQVAEGITIPEKGMFTKESVLMILRDEKALLISNIEESQFRTGDFGTAAITKQPWALALAQAKYGNVQDAVKAAARHELSDDTLLVLVDALIHAGAMQEAITVAETDVAKQGVPDWRQRKQATVLSLIARRQYEKGNPGATATLQKAVQVAQATKNLPDKYLGLIHAARTQAVMGNRTASAETFRQAIQAARAQLEDIYKAHALRQIAQAQAESGDQTASAETFQQAFEFGNKVDEPRVRAFAVSCIAWAQVKSGQRAGGAQKFQQTLQAAESLPANDKGFVLTKIGQWQRIAGEREALAETLERARKAGADVIMLAAQAGYMQVALDQLEATQDVSQKIGWMRFLAILLLTQERNDIQSASLVKRFAQEAPTLAEQTTFKNQRDARYAAKDVAIIQAVAGDLPAALRTIETISDESFLNGAVYPELIQVLTRQGKLAEAQQISAHLKESYDKKGALRDLARLGVRVGDIQGTLVWARKQAGSYARGYALLGVAEGLMDLKGIGKLDKMVPETRWREECPVIELMK
jgi:tetratricopeptide (TPR) repeat protein